MRPHVVRIARRDLRDHYGLDLTDEQVVSILNQDTDLLKEFERYRPSARGFDTFDREALPYLICKYLKIDKRWPCNGDSDSYARDFFAELRLACEAFGFKLVE